MRGALISSVVCGVVLASVACAESLEEVVVTATLREQPLQSVASSVAVLSEETLQGAGQQHLQDVLTQVANLNWAAGSSRPRYFQIRGIGEREQYQGAPNPSVGFLIDDIDFSGLGMAATLFDVDQIEVLRGPQGTRYGANALAGLIAVRTKDPSPHFEANVQASLADYQTQSVGAVASGPVESLNSAWRLAVHQYRSDGFREDEFLGRADTNNRDELTARLKWRWDMSSDTHVDVALLHANLDNGYDAWSIDNTWTSQADRPGKDAQRSNGGSLRMETSAWAPAIVTAIATMADSRSIHSFDGDWGNAQMWAPFVYDYFYRAQRDLETRSLELRLSLPEAGSTSSLGWLIGAYGLKLREGISESSVGDFQAPADVLFTTDDRLSSHYEATNLAVFAQIDGAWTQQWSWALGIRGEERDARYRDRTWDHDTPSGATRDSERNRMWGGNATVSYRLTPAAMLYAGIARGYKAGGFNLGSSAQGKPNFDSEQLWSYELGSKAEFADGRGSFGAALFYMRRRDMQIRTGNQIDPSDPNSYVFFTDNAAQGENYGIEANLQWQLLPAFSVGATAGLLRTEASGFIDANGIELPARDQALAPEYQLALNATYRSSSGWVARLDWSALDRYYFDIDHNQRSDSYMLTHLRVGYEAVQWSAHVWARNVFDESYATRGFYFANDPANPTNALYVQRGDPRVVGVSGEWKF